MSLIIFSHGNSFAASTYGVLLKNLQARGFDVKAIDKYGHDSRYPVSDNWPHLVQNLIDFTSLEVEKAGAPVFLVGHSLGGFLSVMAAALAPKLVRGVMLLDAPILGGWRAATLGVVKSTKLVASVSPGAISQRRRHQWPDKAAAKAHFQDKAAFARWHPQMLDDYIEHGTHDEGEGVDRRRVLSFNRDVETAIYNTLPSNMTQLLKRHPLQCPVAFLGGTRSAEMKQVGMSMTVRICKGRLMMIDGSHLFPMENPHATAAAIEAALLNLKSLNPS